jgi:CubicO group peptidase (beta-lactamase class C family)
MVAVAIRLAAQADFTGPETSAAQELAKHKVPGASIAVVRADRIVYSKAFGTANLETGEPMPPEMLVRIGSTTKMFTAAALVGLAVEGKIDLNAPVRTRLKILPPHLSQSTAILLAVVDVESSSRPTCGRAVPKLTMKREGPRRSTPLLEQSSRGSAAYSARHRAGTIRHGYENLARMR